MSDIEKLIKRLENPANEDIATYDDLCRCVHAIDPHSNVNGSVRDYFSVEGAATLVPKEMLWSITHDTQETRASVGHFPFDGAEVGRARGRYRDGVALCIAALKARQP